MFLRMYNTSDCEYLAELFYQRQGIASITAKPFLSKGSIKQSESSKLFEMEFFFRTM